MGPEIFTLTVWLWVGQRLEETIIEYLSRGECVERLDEIHAAAITAAFTGITRSEDSASTTMEYAPTAARRRRGASGCS
jgi:hypothetical protein